MSINSSLVNKNSTSPGGFEKASAILGRTHRELIVSKQKLGKASRIHLVKINREQRTQELCFASRPFVLCGLPVRALPAGQLMYEKRNGQFVLQITVSCDLLVELVTEDNYILELVREHRLLQALVVPELGFPQEVEPGLLHHPDCPSEPIGAEEDRRTEDAFEGCDQATIFGAPFVHAEDLQHLPGAPESDRRTLLLHGQRCEEDRHDTVLPEWHSELRMRPGYNRTSKQRTGASISDPEARIMRHSSAPCALSYNVQVSTDAAAGIVVSIDASQTVPDYEHLVPAVKQIEERLGKRPKQMVVDAGYTSRENVLALHECGVTMFGRSVQADGRVRQRFARCGVTDGFLPEDFRFDANTNIFVCPKGKVLRPRVPTELPGRTMIRYQAKITDCKVCPQRTQCCSGNTRYGRSIVVTKENPVVTAFRARIASVEGQTALKQRSAVAEFVNAWLKEKLGLRRFRVRGLAKIRTEAMWAALTYNVQQWIRLRWRPLRRAIPVA